MMKIKTKYDVGYEFYVPRVLTTYDQRVIQYTENDGNQYDYFRKIKVLEAIVRHKIVRSIEILITDNVTIKYWCTAIDDDDSLRTIYTDAEMTITDPEVALAFARRWRNEQQCEYFGVSSTLPNYDNE